ncbi:MAG: TonB-dependent receptor [Bacteroidales bacterium]|nr:TonB-dependent receptor [Bacteroidales bacterium]
MKKKHLPDFLFKESPKKLWKVMRLIWIFLLGFIVTGSANSYSQNTRLNIGLQNSTIRNVIQYLEKNSEYVFLYRNEDLNVDKKVNVELKNASINQILDKILEGEPVFYNVYKRQIVIRKASDPSFVDQPVKTITGKVTDDTGGQLPGVTVSIKGTTKGTISSGDGSYFLPGVPDDATLVFSFVGMRTQEVAVGNQTTINITMEEETIGIEEVVAIGYGTVRKSDLTGAISSVSSNKIANVPQTGIANLLQGKVAGTNITTTSGDGDMQIRVRGTTSLNKSNEPLWVVDGVIGAPSPSNPNDIENIQVLKDASATSIYGSQGANGVILVTTKRAKAGSKVVFDTRLVLNTLAKEPDLMSAWEYARAYNEVNGAGSISDADMAAYKAGTKGVDWLDQMIRTGFIQKYNINISGGSQKTQYYVTGTISDKTAQYVTVENRSYTVKGGLTTEIAPWLKFNSFIYSSFGKGHNSVPKDAFDGIYSYSPTMDLMDANGVYNKDPYNSIHTNPYANVMADYTDRNSHTNSLFGDLIFKIADGLTFSTQGLYTKATNQEKNFQSSKIAAGYEAYAVNYNDNSQSWRNINNLTYDKFFGTDHHLTATAVAEFSKNKSSGTSFTTQGISNEATTYWNVAAGTSINGSSSFSNSALCSFLGRLNYSYKGRYLLTGTMRADGASELSKDNRWAYFPSIGLGWNIHEESFFNKNFVNQLKLRASYGTIGNHAVSPYETYARLEFVSRGASYGTQTGYTGYWPAGASNPDLKWEKTAQYNVGLDLGVLGNRITLTTDFYVKNTTDLLFQKSLPSYYGGGNVWVNQGEIRNKGAEFTLTAIAVSNKNFTWETNLTAAYNSNKVLDLAGEDFIIPDEGRGSLYSGGVFILQKGSPVGMFYLYDWAGLSDTGVNLFHTKDGGTTNMLNTEDRIAVGNTIPDWVFGWNNSIRHKNWDANFLFRFTSRFDRLNVGRYMATAMSGPSRFITSREGYNRSWEHVADKGKARYASLTNPINQNTPNSTQFLENGTFLRLQNLSLGYTFPKERTRISDIRLGFNVENLFVLTSYKGLDPETVSETNRDDAQDTVFGLDSGSMPMPRSFTFSVRFDF